MKFILMLRRALLSWCLLLAGIACIAQSERVSASWQSRDSNYNQNVVSGGGGGCAAATTFLARTSGLSGTETTAYTTMICGMVTDGTWCGTTLDALYIFATNTTTTANLNLCSTSYTLTQSGTVTFSADHGYTGDGSTGYFDTHIFPDSGGINYTVNSASLGVYVLTSRAADSSFSTEIGGRTAGDTAVIVTGYLSGTVYDVNNVLLSNLGPSDNAQGSWAAVRTSSSVSVLYKNQSSVATSSTASSAMPGTDITLLSCCTGISADQLSAAYVGAGMNAANIEAIQSRINGYMTALGINVY